MTDTYGPFDSSPWSQSQWYRHASLWAPSGVYGPLATSSSTGDLPLSLSGLNAGVGAGRAAVRGAGFERTGSAVMQAVAANTNASLSRRDRIVLRRDLAAKTVLPTLIQGTPSASPVAPAITQVEAGQWDTTLYSFLVPPNSGTTLTSIVDERGFIDPTGEIAFRSTAARDAYLVAPFDGFSCTVAGLQMVYRAGAWRGVTPLAYGTTTADSKIYTASHDVMTVSVPDPGWSYQLHVQGSVLAANIGSNVTVGAQIAVNGTLINPLGRPADLPGDMLSTDGAALTDPMTGAATVTLRVVVLVSGAPSFGYQCSANDARNKLSVLVIPA